MTSTTTIPSELLSRRDLQFLLFDWLGIDQLPDQSRDVHDAVLELAERLATDLFAPHNRLSDNHEPHLEDGRVVVVPEVGEALEAFTAAGLVGATLDESVGGMELPMTLALGAAAWFQAANASTYAYMMLTTAAANMLVEVGSAEQVQRWVPPMVEGRFFGTMCLTEPQAGSSLADITTRAEPQDDGTYRLFGSKMWISGAEHELSENIVHMVLARVAGAPAGTKGISLFIVPRRLLDEDGASGEPNDVVVAGVNHKMGQRGIVNCALNFGEGVHQPGGERGAVGYLVGEPGSGLASMFRMMNEARIAVGLGAAALGYTGYLKALRYARERPQGRPAGERDPRSPQVPIIEHADVRRMLLAQKAYVEGALALVLYAGRLHDEHHGAADPAVRERAGLLLEILTPIAKSWPSQWCLEANALAIQVHGGYGYSREYDVEQHFRDNRLNPIHEGTHGIQALDLLRRKTTMRDGAALAALLGEIEATVARARAAGSEAAALAALLERAGGRLRDVTRAVHETEDPAVAYANATAYLEAAGHVVVGWLWLEQHLATDDRAEAFFVGKRHTAQWFLHHELPRTDAAFDLLEARDRTVLDMRDEWF